MNTPIVKMQQAGESLARMTTEQLKEELVRLLAVTVENLTRMAIIVRTLEERGEDLNDLRMGIVTYLRKIAHGQLLPEAVVRLQYHPALLARVANLAIPDQQRVIDAESMRLVVIEEGKTTHRLVSPLKMGQADIKQAFASDHIRDEAEQASYLRSKSPRPSRAKVSVQVDAKRHQIIVNEPCTISRSELVNLLSRITD